MAKYRIRPSRRLGQSFSIDPEYVSLYSSHVPREWNGLILEAGSGFGFISLELSIHRGSSTIIALEKDSRLFQASLEVLGPRENVVLVLGDMLKVVPRISEAIIVSSTPFILSVPLILSIARNNNISKAVLGLQKEVAQRITAIPGKQDYGRLTIISSLIFRASIVRCFPPTSFYPKPKVHVCVVVLERKKKYNHTLHSRVEKLTSCLFSHRNKRAFKTLITCINDTAEESIYKMLKEKLSDRRVRELSPGEIEWIAYLLSAKS